MKSVILLVFAVPAVVFSQMREQFPRRPMERLESLKKVRMLEAMKLKEEDGVKLVNRYTNHREVMQDLEKERMNTLDQLEKQLQANASDAEFEKTFSELIELEKRMSDARAKYLNDLREVLTTRQIAEYLVFERNFAKDIRDIMRDIRRGKDKD